MEKGFDLIELTKFVLKYSLNRKTFNTIYFDVNEYYNNALQSTISEVFIRSKKTNAYLYKLQYGIWDKDNDIVKLFKLSERGSGEQKEVFSMRSDLVSKLMNN